MTTDNIAYKFGGTSNNTAETINLCLDIAHEAAAVSVSAPGELSEEQLRDFGEYSHIPEATMRAKVTNNLLAAYDQYQSTGTVDQMYVDAIVARYEKNVKNMGIHALQGSWLKRIPVRLQHALDSPTDDKASMLGEQLQAEFWEQLDFYLLDPTKAGRSLLDRPEFWNAWLYGFDRRVGRIVMGGNMTTDGFVPKTVGRGGSDATNNLLARGLGVRESHIVSDFPLYSFDPKKVDNAQLVPDLTLFEGADLHETGTGTFHHAGIPPMVGSGIPTHAYALKDPHGPRTIYTDELIDQTRKGQVVAISLMDVDILSILEPGMSSRHGRIQEITAALMRQGVNIEHIGDFGSYGISVVLDGKAKADKEGITPTDKAKAALRELANGRGQVLREEQAMVTAVGYHITKKPTAIDAVLGPITEEFISGDAKSEYPHRFEGMHSKRITVDREHGLNAVKEAHRALIE